MSDSGQSDNRQVHHPYDKGYRQLLTNKKAFLQLIRTFVKEKWVDAINENDLILVNKSFVLKDFTEKEADIVYRLKTREGDVIFYILLELQSTVDYTMPFRLLQYMVEIWREIYNNTPLEERERKDFRLPAVIPAVLYNGKNNWTARLEFKEILADYQRFEKHILNFHYMLFDVNRYNQEELYSMANLISCIFMLDQTMSHQELIRRLRKLANMLKALTTEEFRQITTWLKNIIKPKFPKNMQREIDRILDETNPSEVEIMIMNLEITLEEMKQQARMEGKEEGLKEGIKEGIREGIKEGIKEGELMKAMEAAKAAIKKGLSVDDIAEITGLSRDTVYELKNNLN